MNTTVRAFLSIDIEDQLLLTQIKDVQQKLDITAAKMKIVESGNIHFTLRFFCDTALTRLNQIQACLKGIRIDPFEIEIAGVGSFPNKRHPRIIWIGVSKNSSKIQDLKSEIDSSLLELDYQPEKRKYYPHATIARVRHVQDSTRIADNLGMLANEVIGTTTITKAKMMKSTLTSSGPIYETLWQIG